MRHCGLAVSALMEYFVDIFHELFALSKMYTTFFASMAYVLGLACTCVRMGLGGGGKRERVLCDQLDGILRKM